MKYRLMGIWMLFYGVVSGQSLLDQLQDAVTTYERHVNYFLSPDTRNKPELFSAFESLFLAGAYVTLPNGESEVRVKRYSEWLLGFMDGSRLTLEQIRYCRAKEGQGVYEVYCYHGFRGEYLRDGRVLHTPMNLNFKLLMKLESGAVKIGGIEPMEPSAIHDTDSDGDEIPNRCDACVSLKGGLEYDGAHPLRKCPPNLDRDGDGTLDNVDKCPNQFGEPEDGGCPNYTEKEKKAIQFIEVARKTGADSLSLKDMSLTRLPSMIRHLTGLKKLDLSGNQISDYSFFKNLKQLTTLNLRRNQISDISFLKDLKQLMNLDLSGNEIIDISFIKGLKELNTLELSFNEITDYSFLKELKQLTNVTLYKNKLDTPFSGEY